MYMFWTNSNRKLWYIIFQHQQLTMKKISFFYHTIRDWNCLSDETVHTSVPEHFMNYVLP